ncbi:MAG: L,D-transpeptidase family protein [Rhizobiaceae bacterium]
MIRRLLVLSAAVAGISAVDAQARAVPDTGSPEAQAMSPGDAPLQLAQRREVEVYFDGHGRRVLVDRWTGEIIAVQRPRSAGNRRAIREMLRERERRQDRYYLDDPDDMEALHRRKQDEVRRRLREPDGRDVFVETYPEDGVVRARPRYEDDVEVRPRAIRPSVEERRAAREPRIERIPIPELLQREPEPIEPEVAEPDFLEPDFAEPDAMPGSETVEPKIVERAPLSPPDEQLAARDPDPLDEQPGEVIVEPVKPSIEPQTTFGARPEVAALQVLLDRAGVSPGVIDGRFGSNVDKALAAYSQVTGRVLRSTDTEGIRRELEQSGGDPLVDYRITPEDAAGPFVASVPADYGDKARLERMSYTSVAEKLAEKFHMDEAYLKALNPDANFGRPGTIIKVANVGPERQGKVSRIIADKGRKQVRAYGEDGRLIAVYPATIGSEATPSPTGKHTVARVAFDPEYTYNPKLNFKQGDNDKILTIPPGPNNPVGTIWIALSKPTYGIHGTPEPSKIGKSESNGCVRLTNWDAAELARMVQPGVAVEFAE